jgi:hypothetical protein
MNIPSQSGAASVAAEVIEEGNEAQEDEGEGSGSNQVQPQEVQPQQIQQGGQVTPTSSDQVVLKRVDM